MGVPIAIIVEILNISWWRHQIETFSPLLALRIGEFPQQRPVTWSTDILFDLHLKKRLSKQPKHGWSETPFIMTSLWYVITIKPVFYHS